MMSPGLQLVGRSVANMGYGYSSNWIDERVAFLHTQIASNRSQCASQMAVSNKTKDVLVEVETIRDEIVDVVLTNSETSKPVSLPCLEDAFWAIRLDARFNQVRTFRFSVPM